MTALERIALRAPGVYPYPTPPRRELPGERMDVAAFVGVAPRGPSRIPIVGETWEWDKPFVEPDRPRRRSVAVPVESWDEYRRLFSGFEGPGLLPYAVASFFEQGGRKAYIVRIVREYGDPVKNAAAVANGIVEGVKLSAGAFKLTARNEGSWGNGLRAAWGFSSTPVEVLLDGTDTTQLVLQAEEPIQLGALLRLTLKDGPGEPRRRVLAFVNAVRTQGRVDSGDAPQIASLDRVLDDVPVAAEVVAAEVIEGRLWIDDGAESLEKFEGLGLSPLHPRWVATVLCNESELVYPDQGWTASTIEPPDTDLPPLAPELDGNAAHFAGGADRYGEIVPEDFFDEHWSPADADPGDGVHAVTRLADLSTLVVPDLYSPEALDEVETGETSSPFDGARFRPCDEVVRGPVIATQTVPDLKGLRLDPRDADDLKTITRLQDKLVTLAETLRNFVVLLDVPPGITHAGILCWRSRFRSSYAAAYHPWLKAARLDDQREGLIRLNPSAVAAGVIAGRELLFGVPHGPANVIAAGVVDVGEAVSPRRHDELHPLGINVYLRERDGVRLTAARTLSRDRSYRQLSVRRLMLMLRRTLLRQMQWAVFEPNGPSLWADVRHLVGNYLRRLYAAGAFRGDTEAQAFFVRCDGELNDRRVMDAGRMIAEIGVAPAEPLEFIVVRITRGGDGTLSVEI